MKNIVMQLSGLNVELHYKLLFKWGNMFCWVRYNVTQLNIRRLATIATGIRELSSYID